jgi:hypothetical protein
MIQRDYARLGATGCYAFSTWLLARRIRGFVRDFYACFLTARKKNILAPNGFVNEAGNLMGHILDEGGWECEKYGPGHAKPLDTPLKPGEYEILRFEWDPDGEPGTEVLAHFVVGDGKGNVIDDPMGDDSPVVKYGKLVSKRVFRRRM